MAAVSPSKNNLIDPNKFMAQNKEFNVRAKDFEVREVRLEEI